MNHVQEVREPGGRLLAYKIGGDWPAGLQAYSRDEDFVQVLTWSYPQGKRLQAHAHLEVPRTAMLTQEAIVVLQGSARADVYDNRQAVVAQVVVAQGECMVFLAGGHGYEILEDGTRVLEIKNGPFLGVETDKKKF